MKKVVKNEGTGNIGISDAPVPSIGSREVLVRNKRTLISPGTEIGSRYLPSSANSREDGGFGYSSAGVIEAVGDRVTEYRVGERVAVHAPHAEFVVGDLMWDDGSRITAIPDDVTFEQATFLPLTIGAVMWSHISGIVEGDTVAVLGQGLVGILTMQAAREYHPGLLVTTDALDMRCEISRRLGADRAVNVAKEDPVEIVRSLTDGQGADVVIDCVGGRGGQRSFIQAQDMCKDLGRIHLIGLHQGEPLPLDWRKIQRKLLIGGYYTEESRVPFAAKAMQFIQTRRIEVDPLITHHLPFTQAKEGYDLLYKRPDQALGVILVWD